LDDININTKEINGNSTDYLNMLSSNCATSIINIPTRVTQTSATILNHVITNENRHEILSVVIDYAIADHYPVMAVIGKTFSRPLKMLHQILLDHLVILIKMILTMTYY